jgi:Ser/Thr protein kinase RdoA (MazF antagonist)
VSEAPDFHELSPDLVLNLVEEALDQRCTNICRPLTSYINRVYEVEVDDGRHVVIKFYRPGRWSLEALQDEHDFVLELAEDEVPVVPPLRDTEGATLHLHGDLHFALFDRKGGRTFEDPDQELWMELGRLLARMHTIGGKVEPRDRVIWSPGEATAGHVESILSSGQITDRRLRDQYERITGELIDTLAPAFKDRDRVRIHGDCHAGNIIYRPGERFFLIDFDDMAVGPPIQDLWMLLPGYRADVQQELDWFLDGYESFRTFDYPSLKLIEPLRAMRFIHFCAWCVHQINDGGYKRLDPDFGTDAYWNREIRDLESQLERIRIELAG